MSAPAAASENPLRGPQAADSAVYSFDTFEVSWASEGVLSIAMDRPSKLNAQNPKMWAETKAVFDAASADPSCRCAHRAFCKRKRARSFCWGPSGARPCLHVPPAGWCSSPATAGCSPRGSI